MWLTLLVCACWWEPEEKDPPPAADTGYTSDCKGAKCVDSDGDGVWETDCAPDDADVYPGAEEVCDGKDNDCDGSTDEEQDHYTVYADADGDGYGNPDRPSVDCETSSGWTENADDCNDRDDGINPDTPETCNDLDDDCDDAVDEDLTCE